MKEHSLLAYHLVVGLWILFAGVLLIVEPVFTIRSMGLNASTEAVPYLTLIGAFLMAVGLAYLYGAFLMLRTSGAARLETVWLLTAMIRSSVAIFILDEVMLRTLPAGWLTIAIFDGTCVAIQARGLHKGWLNVGVIAPGMRGTAVR